MFGIRVHLFLFIYLFYLISCIRSENLRSILCADPACSEPISEAQGKILYNPGENNVLGFKKGDKIKVLGKTKEESGYWLGKIGNKIGFVPPTYLKEVTVWKSSDMLKYEVPLSIENNEIFIKTHQNSNLGQDNVGTNPLPDISHKNLDTALKGSAGIPLTNLIHGDIPNVPGKFLQQQVKNDPEAPSLAVPGPNVKQTGSNANNIPTVLPKKVNELSSNVNDNNKQELNENLNLAKAGLGKESLRNYVINNTGNVADKDFTVLSKSPETDESDVLNSNSGSEVNSKELAVDPIQARGVDPVASNEKLSSIQNVNEKLGENLKGNVIGSINTINSDEDSEGMNPSTSSNASVIWNDTHDISISSIGSSSSTSSSSSASSSGGSVLNSDKSDQKISSNGISNNTENSNLVDLSSLNETKIGYTAASEMHETTALPKEDKEPELEISETENESQNLSQNVMLKDNTLKEGNITQTNIPSSPEKDENQINVEKVVDPEEGTYNANSSLNSNTPDNSSSGGISTSSSSSTSDGSSNSSSGSSSGSGIVNSSSDVNNDINAEDVSTFSDGVIENLPQENTAIYQDPEQFQEENYPDTMEESTDSSSANKESLTGHVARGSEGQQGIFNVEMPYAEQYAETKNADILPAVTRISSPETTIEKFQVDIPVEGTTEKFNNELPGQQYTSPVDSVAQNTEENISENVVIEPSIPELEHAEPEPAEDDPGESDITGANAEENGFFSKMSKNILGWIGLGDKGNEAETEIRQDVILKELVKDVSGDKVTHEDFAALEGSCRSDHGLNINCEETLSGEAKSDSWSFWMGSKNLNFTSSYKTLIYLIVTAVTVLLFTLGYYFIEKFQSDGSLIAKVNKLEQELLVSSKECLILKDELSSTKEKLNLFETSSNDKIITALQLELEESKKLRSELENNIEVLQQELDAATEAGLDLNKMLSEVLTQKGGSETLMESVEHLQTQLNNQQKIIDEMTTKLIAKTKENQDLQNELSAASEKIDGLEGEIEDMRGNLNVHLKDNEDVISDLMSKNSELEMKVNQLNEAKEKEILKLQKNIGELEKKLKSVSDSLKIKVEECNNLKESVKKIKMKDNKSIDSLFEVSRIKAELGQSTTENISLKERLKAEEHKRGNLEDKVKKMEEEMQKLKLRCTEAQKEKLEAQTRLEVLSNYFKEKETQLQKELGLKEAMWVQKQGDDSTIYERMKSLEEEITSYKSQNDALKKEILDQERGLKAQITALEKKAHENWIAARQAERKLEETKQEGAQLRNKLTLLEKNMSNDLETSQHHRVGEELNGGDSLSPLMHDTSSPLLFPPPLPLDPNNTPLMPPGFIPPPMFMPPPPGGFMPPPPPFMPGDHRPPPLGRMSSPPLNNRFSPPPPEYAYDRMSTPPMSPSSRNYRSPNESDRERFRHRTPTSPSFRSRNWEESPTGGVSGFRPITSERDSRREHKGGSNLSSGHSSDSLDKSSRHSGRV